MFGNDLFNGNWRDRLIAACVWFVALTIYTPLGVILAPIVLAAATAGFVAGWLFR